MAGSHAASGCLAGVLVAGLTSDVGVVGLACAGAVGAGAALLPDLDHPASTASRSQGSVSRALCRAVRALSRTVWAATRTERDDGGYRDGTGAHRHLTHTLPAALVGGLLVGGVAGVHWVALAVVLWLLVSLGLRGLGQSLTGRDRASLSQWTTVSVGAALVVAVVMAVGAPHPVLLGLVVAAGWWTHVLGDWLTRAGVPVAWPVAVRGKRWWMWRSPLGFRADADCWQETAVRWGCWIGSPAAAAWTMMI